MTEAKRTKINKLNHELVRCLDKDRIELIEIEIMLLEDGEEPDEPGKRICPKNVDKLVTKEVNHGEAAE
jgi:hypothetical protein